MLNAFFRLHEGTLSDGKARVSHSELPVETPTWTVLWLSHTETLAVARPPIHCSRGRQEAACLQCLRLRKDAYDEALTCHFDRHRAVLALLVAATPRIEEPCRKRGGLGTRARVRCCQTVECAQVPSDERQRLRAPPQVFGAWVRSEEPTGFSSQDGVPTSPSYLVLLS